MNKHQPGFLIRWAPVFYSYFHPSALGSPPPPPPSSSIHSHYLLYVLPFTFLSIHQHSVSYLIPSHFFIHAFIHHHKVLNFLSCTSSSIHLSSLCTHFLIHPFSIHPSSFIHPSRPLPSPTPQNLRQGFGVVSPLPHPPILFISGPQ
jgi:hypothetical protein